MPLKRDPSLIPLSHDHHHGLVRVFEIRQAIAARSGLARQVEATRTFFASDLRPHFRAEEEIVFPALQRAYEEAREPIARLLEEHRILERSVAALDGQGGDLKAFADLLERHIRFEERELFPLFQQHVPPADRAVVERQVRRILLRPDDTAKACALPDDGS